MSFLLPQDVNFSPAGWGPTSEPVDLFKDIPYAPFSKSEKLGKAADWNANLATRSFQNRPQSSHVSTAFNVFDDEDGDEFSLVDNRLSRTTVGARKTFTGKPQGKWTKPVPRVKGGTNWQNQGKKTKLQQRTANTAKPKYAKKRGGATTSRFTGGGPAYQKNRRRNELSLELESAWGEPVRTIDFSVLNKSTHSVPPSETLSAYGVLEEYNDQFDFVTVRKPIPLDSKLALERTTLTVSTSDDRVLEEYRSKEIGNVYATDTILAVLMSCLVSAYSWDLLLTVREKKKEEKKEEKKEKDEDEDNEDSESEDESDDEDRHKELIFDKRDGSWIDWMEVNENSNEPPMDEEENPYNTVESLSKEATFLNYNFAQQICNKSEASAYKFPSASPFQTDEKQACNAYIYRSFDVADEGIKIVSRSEVNGYKHVKKSKGKPAFLFIRALNEYDPKITGGWRKILETQKAGAFATELKNNNCKMTKWLAQAHLAGAKEIRLGWVSRYNFKDSSSHVILDQSKYTPEDFSNEIAQSFDKLWGTLVSVLKELRKLPAGKYRIVRDPLRKALYVYKTDKTDKTEA